MDEMMLIKDLRRSTPVITAEAKQAARARLTAVITEPGQPQSRTIRARPRALVAGGTAAAIAAGLTLALNIGSSRPTADAAEVLDHAATVAASRPFTPPRPDQWIYQHTREVGWPGAQGAVAAWDMIRWTRASGNQIAVKMPNQSINRFQAPKFPPQDYATVSTLPTDPEALLRWIRTHRPTGDRTTDFEVLGEILRVDGILPPKLEATIFEAMKKLPAVTLRRDVKDLRGRAAIAVIGQTSDSVGGVRINDQILLDPTTYAYRGEQGVLAADLRTQQKDGGTSITKSGTVNTASVIIRIAIVDKPGQQP